jgi:hypothetical protein
MASVVLSCRPPCEFRRLLPRIPSCSFASSLFCLRIHLLVRAPYHTHPCIFFFLPSTSLAIRVLTSACACLIRRICCSRTRYVAKELQRLHHHHSCSESRLLTTTAVCTLLSASFSLLHNGNSAVAYGPTGSPAALPAASSAQRRYANAATTTGPSPTKDRRAVSCCK